MNQELILLKQEFVVESVLKSTERTDICLVREKETQLRYIYRRFPGTGEVYRRLSRASCSHLPRIHAVWEENGNTFVLEEYIQGDTLDFLLDVGALPLEQTISIGLQICEALAAIHALGAVHRDIKPENIILQGNHAVLIDFDASRLCKAELDMDTRVMGTTGYAAPEQYGFSQTDARADIYAMGVLLNEMRTRQHPSKHLASGVLGSVIEACIEVNVDKRCPSAETLHRALRVCEKKSRRKSMRPVWMAVAALGIFLVGMLTGGILQRERAVQLQIQTEALSQEHWSGEDRTHETPFRYDLDGDGQPEDYVFGIYHLNIPDGFRWTTDDNFAAPPGETYTRTVFPCVWQYDDAGNASVVEDFAQLLTDCKVTLWRRADNDSALPKVSPASGTFSGGIQVLYTEEQLGTWYYEISAQLGEQKLTALAVSNVSNLE